MGTKTNDLLWKLIEGGMAAFCMYLVSLYSEYPYPWIVWILVGMVAVLIVLIVWSIRKTSNKKDRAAAQIMQANAVLREAIKALGQTDHPTALLNAHYALYLYDRIQTANPESFTKQQFTALSILHASYTATGQYPAALKYGTEALKLDVHNYAMQYNMALMFSKLHRYENAMNHAQQALQIDPSNKFAQELLEQSKARRDSGAKPDDSSFC
jgi:tetratricopeptide (TPR) repeat protein